MTASKRRQTSLKESIEILLNKQIQVEAQSSAAYLAMASWCDAQGFENSGAFFFDQSDEERLHMLKLYKYIGDVGGQPISPGVDLPNHDYESLKDVFETALEAEISVSESINNIVAECRKQNDFATEEFMRWFIKEQIEEEFVARRALELLDMLSDDQNGLLLFDERVNSIVYDNADSAE